LANRELFAELMLSWEMRSYEMAMTCPRPYFFDRGIPDVLAYLRLINAPVPVHVQRAADNIRYAATVFIAPPWPEIYVQDDERKQDFEEAAQTYEALVRTYTECGYSPCILPRDSAENRAAFVISHATAAKPK
jgi:predicted ATPase